MAARRAGPVARGPARLAGPAARKTDPEDLQQRTSPLMMTPPEA
jgi:hypothetical protein